MLNRFIAVIASIFLVSSHVGSAIAQQPNNIVALYRQAIKDVSLARDHTPTGQLIGVAPKVFYDGHGGRDLTGEPVTSLVVSIEYQNANPSDRMTLELFTDNGRPEDQTVIRSCEFNLYPTTATKGCRLCFPARGDEIISNSISLPSGKYLIGIYVNETPVLKTAFRVSTTVMNSSSCATPSETFTAIQQKNVSLNPATITVDSVACKSDNLIVSYRDLLNDKAFLADPTSSDVAKAGASVGISDDYKRLLPDPQMWGKGHNATTTLLAIKLSVDQGYCVWARKGTRVSIMNVNQKREITQIRGGDQNTYYWIWSSSVAPD